MNMFVHGSVGVQKINEVDRLHERLSYVSPLLVLSSQPQSILLCTHPNSSSAEDAGTVRRHEWFVAGVARGAPVSQPGS